MGKATGRDGVLEGRRAQPGGGGEVHVRTARPQRRGRVEGAGRQGAGVRGRRFGRGHVDDHDPVEAPAPGEVAQVRREAGDEFLVATCVAGQGATGPDLPVGRGQFAAYGGGQAVRQDAGGLQFLCLVPSTVQSSIAFTSIARGNVPAAICAGSFSSLVGIVATP
ncbi:bile acid:sodium symporter, partial [Streptomyces albidochromogenes]|uniref:bile acid:sodium symporter n=1 Tax=Streptomyces albidochromogenes TaxID=329524 RepID=UPI003F6E1E31